MEFEQSIRQSWRRIRLRISEWRSQAGVSAGRAAEAGRDAFDHPRAGLIARICLIAALVLFVLYPLIALFHSTIDDDPDFAPKTVVPGASHAVAAGAALINREIHKHGWMANAPWFSPNALLDNMPNYQKGIVQALSRFALDMSDRIGRSGATAQVDPDLKNAADLLRYQPDIWIWSPSVSLLPTATSEQQYKRAAKALRAYNKRLGSGQAAFDRRADNLQVTLDRIGADLGASSATIQDHLDRLSGWPFDTTSDDVFYTVKGQIYAYYIVLKGLQVDFAPVIAQRDLSRPWANMMTSLRAGIALRPMIVLNGAPDSDVFPCTLCGEGFYLLRARAQLREIRDSLQQ
jgi:hypothetical protein